MEKGFLGWQPSPEKLDCEAFDLAYLGHWLSYRWLMLVDSTECSDLYAMIVGGKVGLRGWAINVVDAQITSGTLFLVLPYDGCSTLPCHERLMVVLAGSFGRLEL
ncbi:hypothetical protein GOP47_0008833 [Adiantum capillus-veneris]|uniref:Uncharacterized protein n=1 Tax=Adiantum capillus-veneris TaxID=13818 RepID=A0A9D4UZB3_ADICA|nr:hypothetical protein GOP47_0008833 [Adiantum capillus-veneris]